VILNNNLPLSNL